MNLTKNKLGQKLKQKSETTQNMDIDQETEVKVTQLNKQRKRNRFKNVDWEQVLDFDTLAENKQIYEVPWMQTNINKRKRVFTQSDKSISEVNLQSCMNDVNHQFKNEKSPFFKGTAFKKNQKQKTGSNNITKTKEEKQQKKPSIDVDSSKNSNKQLETNQLSNLGDINNYDMEEENTQISKEKFTEQISLLQTINQLEPNSLKNKNILQGFSYSSSTGKQQIKMNNSYTLFLQSLNNLPFDEENLQTLSKSAERDLEEEIKNNGLQSQNEQRFDSPLKKQKSSKFMKNSLKKNRQDSTSYTYEENFEESSNEKSTASQTTRSSKKLSPTSFCLNDEIMIVNQQYFDSDASTRDDNNDNQMKCNPDDSMAIVERSCSTRNGEKADENFSSQQKSNNNQKKNIFVNEKLINGKEIKNNQNLRIYYNNNNKISEQNISYHTDDRIQSQMYDDLDSITSQQTLKFDDKRFHNSSYNKKGEIEAMQNQKSIFSKKIPHHPNDSLSKIKELKASCQLPSNQSVKIDEDMNVDDSGFENSNNCALTLQQGLQQQEFNQDQQPVPHLYIRHLDFAIKVGVKNQALIPDMGSYNKQDMHLERLITKQKVWGYDWIENKEKTIEKCTKTLKQWFGYRRNQEQCLQHLLLIGFDESLYNTFLEQNQNYLFKVFKEKDKKEIAFFNKVKI